MRIVETVWLQQKLGQQSCVLSVLVPCLCLLLVCTSSWCTPWCCTPVLQGIQVHATCLQRNLSWGSPASRRQKDARLSFSAVFVEWPQRRLSCSLLVPCECRNEERCRPASCCWWLKTKWNEILCGEWSCCPQSRRTRMLQDRDCGHLCLGHTSWFQLAPEQFTSHCLSCEGFLG